MSAGPVALLRYNLDVVLATGALLVVASLVWSSLANLWHDWNNWEEYSHGMLLPLVSAWLLWSAHAAHVRTPGRGWGVAVFAVGLLVALLGRFSTIHALAQYGFVVCTAGAVLAVLGTGRLRHLLFPLLLLLFMVPLPHFLHQALSAELQLLSSQIGVWFIRLLGISVYLQGNVIDLGTFRLQVIEACDGLRYLFPLSALSFMFACLFRGRWWQRLLLFASAVPITVLMNSFRIGSIGFMVEHWGPSMAEGFLHDFQGWTIFMVCVVILLLEARLLAWLSGDGRGLLQLLDPMQGPAAQVAVADRPVPGAALTSPGGVLAMALGCLTFALLLDTGKAPELERRQLIDFPMRIGADWSGRRRALERIYLDALRLDDYLMADFRGDQGRLANLYVAYYDSQIAGASAHSPRTCIPGDGWRIDTFETVLLADGSGRQVPVNRAIIAKGPCRQLVYYWFEQRNRVLANEYAVKWYLLQDSLLSGRTDGALVRLMSPILDERDEAGSETALRELFVEVRSRLPEFLPG